MVDSLKSLAQKWTSNNLFAVSVTGSSMHDHFPIAKARVKLGKGVDEQKPNWRIPARQHE